MQENLENISNFEGCDLTLVSCLYKNILNIKNVSVKRCLYVVSNTLATSEAQLIKKLSNAGADLEKKALIIKKDSF